MLVFVVGYLAVTKFEHGLTYIRRFIVRVIFHIKKSKKKPDKNQA